MYTCMQLLTSHPLFAIGGLYFLTSLFMVGVYMSQILICDSHLPMSDGDYFCARTKTYLIGSSASLFVIACVYQPPGCFDAFCDKFFNLCEYLSSVNSIFMICEISTSMLTQLPRIVKSF